MAVKHVRWSAAITISLFFLGVTFLPPSQLPLSPHITWIVRGCFLLSLGCSFAMLVGWTDQRPTERIAGLIVSRTALFSFLIGLLVLLISMWIIL